MGSSGSFKLAELKAITTHVSDSQAQSLLPKIRLFATTYKAAKYAHAHNLPTPLTSEEQLRQQVFCRNPRARITRIDQRYIHFVAPRLTLLPKLPRAYGFKGGAARLALRAILGETVSTILPRDFDLVRLGAGDATTDQSMAAQYTPEDFMHGNPVEVLPGIEDYFASRDLSINEVLLLEGKLICTHQAFSDTLARILRPTAHISSQQDGVNGLTLMKMLRLQAEALSCGQEYTLAGVEKEFFKSVQPFHVKLHLDRVKTAGPKAEAFYRRGCFQMGIKCGAG